MTAARPDQEHVIPDHASPEHTGPGQPNPRSEATTAQAGSRRAAIGPWWSGLGAGRAGAAGLWAIGLSLGCFLLTALLGTSVMAPALPGEPGQPPYSLGAHPSPYLVIGLVVLGILTGTGGLALCFAAVGRGWRCRAMPLVVSGILVAAAFVLLPPIGSGDHLNYAAYGRMAVLGHDPYATSAADLPGDPVVGAVEEWRRAPSVYGPLATAQEAVASRIGGESVRLTVFVMSLINALAFALTAVVLYWTSGTPGRRLRTALMWTCNPLLLFHLVAGAHNDTLAIAPMVAALAIFTGRRRATKTEKETKEGQASTARSLAAGALVGAALAIKLPAVLAGGGPAWVLLRRRRTGHHRPDRSRDGAALWRLAAFCAGAGLVVAGLFALAGPHAFDQVGKASNSVSLATPWHLFDMLTGRGGDRTVIKIGAAALLLVLLWLLARALPHDGPSPRSESLRISAALVLAWLFSAPYVLPWYDGFAWAALALLPWSRFDWLLLAHTGALGLAYLPARDPKLIGLPGGLEWLVTVLRPWIIPVLTTATLIALVRACRRPADGPAPAPVRSRRASTGSPG